MHKSNFFYKPLALLIFGLSANNAFAASVDLSTWNQAGIISSNNGVTSLNTGDAAGQTFLVSGGVQTSTIVGTSSTATTSFNDQFGNAGTFGSVLSSSTLNIAGNHELSFTWDFQTQDSLPANDFALIDINNGITDQQIVLSSIYSLGGAVDSGNKTFNYLFSSAFTGTISFVVSNGGDNTWNSALSLSNASINAVPEPEEWALLAFGLPLMAAALRRKS
jgi:hypothetical protein